MEILKASLMTPKGGQAHARLQSSALTDPEDQAFSRQTIQGGCCAATQPRLAGNCSYDDNGQNMLCSWHKCPIGVTVNGRAQTHSMHLSLPGFPGKRHQFTTAPLPTEAPELTLLGPTQPPSTSIGMLADTSPCPPRSGPNGYFVEARLALV